MEIDLLINFEESSISLVNLFPWFIDPFDLHQTISSLYHIGKYPHGKASQDGISNGFALLHLDDMSWFITHIGMDLSPEATFCTSARQKNFFDLQTQFIFIDSEIM